MGAGDGGGRTRPGPRGECSRLPPARPEIVSGNVALSPPWLLGQRGDKAARGACLGCLSADTADRLL